MTKYLFAGGIYGQRRDGYEVEVKVVPFAIIADNEESAYGKGYLEAKIALPQDEGWDSHQITLVEVPVNMRNVDELDDRWNAVMEKLATLYDLHCKAYRVGAELDDLFTAVDELMAAYDLWLD